MSLISSIAKQPKPRSLRNSFCFSEDNLERLRQIMYFSAAEAGSYLFREGERSNRLLYVQSGNVKATKLMESGKEYIFGLSRAGDFIGQLDPLQESRHFYTAQTMDACEIGVIQNQDLEVLLWQHGDLAVEFAAWMGYMHRLTQTKLRDLLMLSKPGALCSTILRLANTYGVEGNDGTRIAFRLTNSELADYIGCARESVNRMLADLRRAGAISIHDNLITILDKAYLRHISRCELCPAELCRL
ncbi:Crp/Fnr family transcriptional regulator [Cohnella fermenti]|uniref:Crp/Fnr family transcriptional regulator n=1 Tax=Cohnella fermenti TaxID=2565925 RepID=A0A4S4BTB6_9BACL|nr:Crp/Fnr family transcriptional regulator [Cohnella fermenti]THF76069.1 Crp/Fnr family transcriptional regulator [Cohnella fermenti]